MTTNTDPEGWDELHDLLEAQLRLGGRWQLSIEANADGLDEETERWRTQNEGFKQRIDQLLEGRPDLQAKKEAWFVEHGRVTREMAERSLKYWGLTLPENGPGSA